MGMFNDLHNLDREQQQEAAAPARPPRRAKPHTASSPPPQPTQPPAADDTTPEDATLPASAASRVSPAAVTPSALPREDGDTGQDQAPTPPPTAEVAPPVWNLSELPYRKDTFLFTNEEFEALEDLKLALRRKLDIRVTKNDLARCAIAYMVDDYKRRADQSPVFAPLRTRRGR